METPWGRWQGARWRRSSRFATAVLLVLVIALSWMRSPPQASQALWGGALAVAVFAVNELLLARRLGFELEPTGLTLRGALRRTHIPWPAVEGFRWSRSALGRSRTLSLYVETSQRAPRRFPREAPVRIPTVAWCKDLSLPNDRLLGPVLTSPDARSSDGVELDVTSLLERARREAGG